MIYAQAIPTSARPQVRYVYSGLPAGTVKHRTFASGLGLTNQQTQQSVQIGAGIATPVITGILASHAAATAAATGMPALIAGMAPAVAVPIIGAAIVGVTILAITLIRNSGCGQTCVITAQWANQAADLLQQNSDAYFGLTPPRPRAAQGVALANYDAIWAALQAQCGQRDTGDAGVRCITDRQAGACVWRQNRTPGHPGEPAMGECWNWFSGYRDPIANDTEVDAGGLLPDGLIPAGLPTVAGVAPAVWLPVAVLVALGVALL